MVRQPITDDDPPSRATYLAVSRATGRDPLDLPPLAECVDTDALDSLTGLSDAADDVETTFEYAGCIVTVTGEEVRVDAT